MGLGPPVCTKCRVIKILIDIHPYWKCPICNETKCDKNLWELSKEEQTEYQKRIAK
jgi:hypothetical protein